MNKWHTIGALRAPEDEGGGPPLLPVEDLPGVQAAPRRAGSMTLRDAGSAGFDAAALDPANQSLADALNVIYKLVILAMIALAVLWVLSGFRVVNEGSRGVRVLFGRIQDSNLEPGFRWSAPFPFGELVSVDQGYREVPVQREFWFYVPEGADPAPEKNAATPSLNPDQGGAGSVLTKDGNIAHTRWRISYTRQGVSDFAANVNPEFEESLVKTASMRGIVQAASMVTIDTLLKQGGEDGSSAVAEQARILAQSILDRSNTGIQIQQFILDSAIPPLFVRSDFAAVQSAVAKANEQRESAESDARRTLNEVAGDAAPALLELIDRYELSLAQKKTEESNQVLAQIDTVLLSGRRGPTSVAGSSGESAAGQAGGQASDGQSGNGQIIAARTSGRAAQLLDEANLYRSQVVSQGQSDLAVFLAKLEQFNANPSLMVKREWTDAYLAFLSNPSVEVMLFPEGTDLINVMINRDPNIERLQDQARRQREADEQRQRRIDEFNASRYQTQTGVQVTEE